MFDFISKKFSSIFSGIKGAGYLTEANLQKTFDSVKDALLEADVPYDLVETFIASIKKEVVGQKVLESLKPDEQLLKIINDKLIDFLGGKGQVSHTFQLPSVVMVMGLQGSGKTTSIAKMAYLVEKQAQQRGKTRRILLGSVDFYRPAAIDQLEVLSKQLHADFYRAQSTDPVTAAQEIYKKFKNEGYELLFLDTAGRLHVDSTMLQELQNIDAHLEPRYKLLILDAMTGQESLNVAQAFDQSIGFKSAILTKMDSDTRGGAAFAFRYALKKPIAYVGTGEKLDDFEQFHPERAAGRMLGMGDLQSLVEKANEKIKQSEQDKMAQSMMSGSMTLEDFASQLGMINKLGSLSKVMKFMPGMGSQVSDTMIEQGEKEMNKFKAIISSMTKKERIYPKILNASRKQRVAKGAGVKVQEINLLLQRFEQLKQYAKLFKKRGPFSRLF